jgi:hypothetical protein
MRFVFIYGPDGSGKTTIAIELVKRLENSIILPFEPGNLGSIVDEIDSGFQGANSAMNKSIPVVVSLLFFIRHALRYFLFYLRYSKTYKYVIVTRGPLEFGINNTHRNFPKILSLFLQKILSKHYYLVNRPVNLIFKKKPELSKLRILELYEEYIKIGIKPLVNMNLKDCTDNLYKLVK